MADILLLRPSMSRQPSGMSNMEAELAQTPGPQSADAPMGVPKWEFRDEGISVLLTVTAIAVVVLLEMTWIVLLGWMTIRIIEPLAGG
jgi:hypothetical protein